MSSQLTKRGLPEDTQYTSGAVQGLATSTVRLTDADKPAELVTV